MRRRLDEGPLARFSALVPGAAVGFVVIPRFALAVAPIARDLHTHHC